MNLKILKPPSGAIHKRKRVGRGPGSGHGKTSTRGHKGQKSRGRGKVYPWFEGGQMPLTRRLPKRGFHPVQREEFEIVNVTDLNIVEDNTVVDPVFLREKGFVKNIEKIKVLGNGILNKSLHVKAHSFSHAAKKKIEEAGGDAEVIKC
ncbi:50S ribosomal protein L15 [Candidatus Aerophobetes bacterium]|nr:50S ribosomal protein L15 [Candidatus Aerophobetes bacterium]